MRLRAELVDNPVRADRIQRLKSCCSDEPEVALDPNRHGYMLESPSDLRFGLDRFESSVWCRKEDKL